MLWILPLTASADVVGAQVTPDGAHTSSVLPGGTVTVRYMVRVDEPYDVEVQAHIIGAGGAVHETLEITGQPPYTVEGDMSLVIPDDTVPGAYPLRFDVRQKKSNGGWGAWEEGQEQPGAVIVLAPEPPDTTPPVIMPSLVGTLGNNGWYVSDVTVTWSVVDNESAISSSSGCDATGIISDTAGMTLTCTATSAGGTATESVTVKRDATPPTIEGTASPAPNANGWNNTDVMVSFTCDDSGSGIATCGPDQTLSSEGEDQSVTGTASDAAGNSASAAVSGINIDKTAPTLAPVISPDPVVLNGQATGSANATDSLSGLASQSCGPVDTSSVGIRSVECAATDNAGNTATAITYCRVVYAFSGFFQPIPLPVSTFKTGSTIPVKFSLADANGVSVGTALATVSANGVPQGTARYDSTAQQYIFNLKTKGMSLGTLVITVSLDDGTTNSVTVTLK